MGCYAQEIIVIVADSAVEAVPAAIDCDFTVPEAPVSFVPGVIEPVSATVQPEPEMISVLPLPSVTVQVPTSAAGIPVPVAIVTFVPTAHVPVPPET